MSVELQVGAVVFGAELDAAHVFEFDQSAILPGLDHQISEVGGLHQASDSAHAHLELLARQRRFLAN